MDHRGRAEQLITGNANSDEEDTLLHNDEHWDLGLEAYFGLPQLPRPSPPSLSSMNGTWDTAHWPIETNLSCLGATVNTDQNIVGNNPTAEGRSSDPNILANCSLYYPLHSCHP